jgi:hypothetical protein
MNKIFNYVNEPHNLLHRKFGGMICGCMILIHHFVSVLIFNDTGLSLLSKSFFLVIYLSENSQGELGENREKWEDI